MHDPMTLIYEVPGLFMLWHVDPEVRGDDDSCGWFTPNLTDEEIKLAKNLVHNPDDNVQHWFGGKQSIYDLERFVYLMFGNLKRLHRPWWRHPRWHIHHWKLTIIPLRDFKRWAFTRCAACGKRMPFGYAPVSGQWNSKGPRWFKSEERKYHHECYGVDGPKETREESA
ncbi:MAG: hypothetical protein DWQ07_13980 [Chloroflexi bacterium]|nr:MAG: hypothetical protein DWQ07_13980 [Chloroflexota bacterium]